MKNGQVLLMDDLQAATSIECLAEEQAGFCSLFGNARRIQILWALADRELSVGAIAKAVGSSLQNVSQHLSRMKDFNLVSSRREGQTIYYRIEKEALTAQCLNLLQANVPEVPHPD
jgi:DNA-binding transcriptional ArsR family regulator